jgi:hypothetical protein
VQQHQQQHQQQHITAAAKASKPGPYWCDTQQLDEDPTLAKRMHMEHQGHAGTVWVSGSCGFDHQQFAK